MLRLMTLSIFPQEIIQKIIRDWAKLISSNYRIRPAKHKWENMMVEREQ